jgi:hypothetical protein
MIREVLVAAGIFYLLINLVQGLARAETQIQAIVFGTGLLIITGAYWIRDEKNIHHAEIPVVWAAVFLFVAYAAAKFLGVV